MINRLHVIASEAIVFMLLIAAAMFMATPALGESE